MKPVASIMGDVTTRCVLIKIDNDPVAEIDVMIVEGKIVKVSFDTGGSWPNIPAIYTVGNSKGAGIDDMPVKYRELIDAVISR